MIILKLLIILLFILMSSKGIGVFLKDKSKISYETSLGIGYLANIAIFLIAIFVPLYFRLSSSIMTIFGMFYLIACLYFIYYAIKKKLLFKFSKKEIISLLVALVFTLLFALFVDFGNAEMYDSYFYSILTNSASNSKHLAIINPYNGISDLQNFYKYLSFYYQSSFFSIIFDIKPAYLVLIWPFTFMTYYLLSITALGVARISKDEKVNNILSIFIITFYTTFFRAPFNALHMVNIIIPIYMLKFIFDSMKNEKNIKIYYILFIAAAACSSAILYTSITAICAIFIASCFKKNYNKINTIFKLIIPTYVLGVIYVMESNRNVISLIIAILVLLAAYLLLKSKTVNKICKVIGMSLLFIIPIVFIAAPYVKDAFDFQNLFLGQGNISDKLVTTAKNRCISGLATTYKLSYKINYDVFSTAMKYIYQNPTSLINTLLIIITHSVLMYGGLFFFLIHGFIKTRKDHIYISFVVYLLIFFNPLVSKGLALLTLDLNDRIYLYFNTFFALYGLKYFFEWVLSLNKKYFNVILKYLYIPYLCLLILSVYSYISLLKKPEFDKFDPLYKVPINFVKANNEVNRIVSKKTSTSVKSKPTVLYTLSTLNLTMIDKNPNNKYKLIDSKEYKSYYFDIYKVFDKAVLMVYFDSDGSVAFDNISSGFDKESRKMVKKNNCDIKTMLDNYNTDFIVMSENEKDTYKKLRNYYAIVYNKNEIIVLERSK